MSADRIRYTESWVLSLVGHGAIVALSIAFVSALKPVPEREPFRWDVALVDVATPSPQSASASAPAAPPVESPVESPAPALTPEPAPVQRRAVERPAPTMPPPPAPSVSQPAPSPTVQRSESAVERVERVPEPQQAPFPTFEAMPPSESAPSAANSPRADAAAPSAVAAQAAPPSVTAMAPPATSVEPNGAPQTPAPPATATSQGRPDISWLSGFLSERLRDLAYPTEARINGWEGRVVIRLIIHEDGRITDIVVKESSGHRALDDAAKQAVEALSPLPLPQPLLSPKTVNVPMNYHLK